MPIMRAEASVAGLYEAGAMDIDVAALHQGFLRGLRRRGGALVVDAGVVGLEHEGRASGSPPPAPATSPRRLSSTPLARGPTRSPDSPDSARSALTPKRRTVALIDGPNLDFSGWPLVIDAGEQWYFKPDAGRLLISPADETDSEPCDAQPDDLDVAIAADRVEKATTLTIRRIAHRWAGLRTVRAPDRTPVCGFDPRDRRLLLAGRTGRLHSIQTSPALAQLTARLIAGVARWTPTRSPPRSLRPAWSHLKGSRPSASSQRALKR